jgi:hypothetical protein
MDNYVLYRCWDSDGNLLYIGLSWSPGDRFRQHEREKSWWPLVESITLEHYDSPEELSLAEVNAIQSEHPLYNEANRTPPKRRRRAQVPSARRHRSARNQERDDEILRLRALGYSYREIESTLKISRGAIYNVLRHR